jgi:hypothetical protein
VSGRVHRLHVRRGDRGQLALRRERFWRLVQP